MKKSSLLLLFILFCAGCKEAVKDTPAQGQAYGNTTKNTILSAEKIDGSITYEIRFTLEKPAECMTIDIETVYLQKSFPVQKIPKRTFFIVEKKLILPQFKTRADNYYTPMGRNFNNDWEIYSPVKICGSRKDPLSILDLSEYRIRFSAFEKNELYYKITITCESRIIFKEQAPPPKKQ